MQAHKEALDKGVGWRYTLIMRIQMLTPREYLGTLASVCIRIHSTHSPQGGWVFVF